MTDEARIKRLTELARRVWPREADVRVYAVETTASVTARESPVTRVRLLHAEHPRALDALEAALMVLADPEAKTITRESFAEAVGQAAAKLAESSADLDAKLREMVGDPPAWVEQLAGDFEANKGIYQDGEEAALDCAKLLRERARKP